VRRAVRAVDLIALEAPLVCRTAEMRDPPRTPGATGWAAAPAPVATPAA
jgi:hypothetical protein